MQNLIRYIKSIRKKHGQLAINKIRMLVCYYSADEGNVFMYKSHQFLYGAYFYVKRYPEKYLYILDKRSLKIRFEVNIFTVDGMLCISANNANDSHVLYPPL